MMIINYTDTKKEDLIKFKPKVEIDVEAKMNELAERGIYTDFYNSKGELVASSKKKMYFSVNMTIFHLKMFLVDLQWLYTVGLKVW